MNINHSDKLDALLSLATAQWVDELNDEFLSAQSEIELTPQTNRRILRMLRKDKRRTPPSTARMVFKYLMLAVLIAATVAFTACMALPRIREAIWKIMLEWHDEYVSVQFVPATEDSHASANKPSDSTNTTEKTNDPTIVLPLSIEEINIPKYMPIGYTTKSSITESIFRLSYYDENDSFIFSYHQMVIGFNSTADSENGTLSEIEINGLNAVVIAYSDDPNVYCLYWQDNQYRYRIYGYFEDYNELIRLASSVDVK